MADYRYTTSLTVGGIGINEASILLFSYRSMWDRGNRLAVVIYDADTQLHQQLAGIGGTPTIPITFQLFWKDSKNSPYLNQGSPRTLYVERIGQVTTPRGLAIRILAVDLATLVLNKKSSSYHAINSSAATFIQDFCSQFSVTAQIAPTGDSPDRHRAHNVIPMRHIRYELDRTLSTGGKPLSLQFDDRKAQTLIGQEELYGSPTTLVGSYVYGIGSQNNGGVGSSLYTTIYHYESDVDFAPALAGHTVTAQGLTFEDGMVSGKITPILTGNLGITADVLTSSERRITAPLQNSDAANSDAFIRQAIMTNTVFHSEMSVTSGLIVVSPDYKLYDDPTMFNRKHVTISIIGASNAKSGNAITPQEAVIMGFNHVITPDGQFTRVYIRRGK